MTLTRAQEDWTQLRSALRSFVGKRVAPEDTDDVLQEAMLRIHRGIASLQDEERLIPWLYRVTRNAVTDHHRQRGASRLNLADSVEEAEAETSMSSTDRERVAACVLPFVAELSEPNQTAVRLVELQGLRIVDAAAQLGVGVPTLKARVQRGRAQLREALEGCCAFERDARGTVLGCQPLRRRTCGVS